MPRCRDRARGRRAACSTWSIRAATWRDWVSWPQDDDEDEAIVRRWPFTLEWPGLAAAQRTPLTAAERQHALEVVLPRFRQRRSETPAARIGLVAAGRPADVLLLLGWSGLTNWGEETLPLTAVLRSWEDRFGARLIDVGYATVRLFVERPPRTLAAAQVLAAEQVVLADECFDGDREIPGFEGRQVNAAVWTGEILDLAARLVNAPIWTF